MSEILRSANIISEQNKEAEKIARAKDIEQQKELNEKQLLGTERARQFVELMKEHDISTEEYYEENTDSTTIYPGWNIETLLEEHTSRSNITRGFAVLQDLSVVKWENPHNNESRKVIIDTNVCEKLGDNTGLDILGKRVVELGILDK